MHTNIPVQLTGASARIYIYICKLRMQNKTPPQNKNKIIKATLKMVPQVTMQ